MFEKFFNRYPFFRYIPAILCMAFLFRSSATPGSDIGWLVPPWDKVLHALAYACLAFSLALCFKRKWWETRSMIVFIVSVCLSALYGASDEWHQSFVPGRDAGIPDFVADCCGSFVGVTTYFIILKFSQLKRFAVSNQQKLKI